MATANAPSFRDILGRLVPALSASGPESPEVAALVQSGKQLFPERAAQLDALLLLWRDFQGKPNDPPLPPMPPSPDGAGATATPPTSSWSGWLTHGGVLGLGAVGALLAANWKDLKPLVDTLSNAVTPIWAARIIIVLAGAVGGLANAFRASSALVLPRIQNNDGKLTFLPGFLGNMGVGALAAIVTVWVATPSDGAPTADQVLTPIMVASAFAAGLGGSLVATGYRDAGLFRAVAQRALAAPSNPAAAQRMANLTGPQAAAAMGIAIGNLKPPPVDPKQTEAELMALLSKDRLKEVFARLEAAGRPKAIARDGVGLPLGALGAMQGKPLLDAVKDLPLMVVAGMDQKDFRPLVPSADGSAAPQADAVWSAARDVKSRLDLLPDSWRLTPASLV